MRSALSVLAAVLLVLGMAVQAQAKSLEFSGQLSIQLSTLDPVGVPGGGTAVVNAAGGGDHLTSLAVPKGAFTTAGFILPVTDPGAAPIMGVQVTASNQTGTFTGSGGFGLGGFLQLKGFSKVCLFRACNDGPIANVSVPLDPVGAGGSTQVSALVNVTVQGAPWTTATQNAGFGATITMGSVQGPNGLTSSTAQTSGKITLVTPIFISTSIAASATVPGFGLLQLTFATPEPQTLALGGAAVATLVGLGWWRRRR
jgi:hypothetical protein